MSTLATDERFSRGIRLENIDEAIWDHDLDMSDWTRYEYAISDRNDSALMTALVVASTSGCRALKNRLLAGL
ncbi:MAG TPA: hypothetical protein VIY48_18805 [Candidatus Paceibacterota bacterium]